MIMRLQLDIRDSWGKRPQKDQEEYEDLAQSHGDTIQRTPNPKGKMSAWARNAKHELTRAPMYGQALPFTSCHL